MVMMEDFLNQDAVVWEVMLVRTGNLVVLAFVSILSYSAIFHVVDYVVISRFLTCPEVMVSVVYCCQSSVDLVVV